MASLARALIIRSENTNSGLSSGDGLHSPVRSASTSTVEKLPRFNVSVLHAQAGRNAEIDYCSATPDLIILDVNLDCCIDDLAAISKNLKHNPTSGLLPVVVFSDPAHFHHFDADAFFDSRMPANILARKIKQLVRLGAMRHEYQRRRQTAQGFGIEAPEIDEIDGAETQPLRILVIGRGERYFQLASVFGGQAVLRSAENFYSGVELLMRETFDCLVIDTLSPSGFRLEELEALKENLRFFTLPVILLQEGLPEDEQHLILEQGLCDLFELDGDAPELAAFLRTTVQSERIRRSLHQAFNSPALSKISDFNTGLPNGKFFERHVERLTAHAQAWNLPIAFGVFQVVFPPPMAGLSMDQINKQLVGQIGQMISSLIRTQDIATHLGAGKFIIATPNASAMSISVLVSRIGSVLRSTEFLVAGCPSKVEIRSATFVTERSDSADAVMERLKGA
ncbi:MAG: hypothetical protein AAGE61_04540 [Pseudomonadota bacterium]